MLNRNATLGLHRLVQEPKTIIYYSVLPDDSQTGVTIRKVESRPMSTEEMLIVQAGNKKTRTFHVWSELLGDVEPKEGDYLVCESVWWTVDKTKSELNDSRWRLLCIKRKNQSP